MKNQLLRIASRISYIWRQQSPKAWRPVVWILALALFVIMLSSWVYIAGHTIQLYEQEFAVSHLRVLVSAPKYLSPNEDEEISFVIQNLAAFKTHAVIHLTAPEREFWFVGLTERSKCYEGDIDQAEQINCQLKIRFPYRQRAILNQPAHLNIRGMIGNQKEERELAIAISPIPKSRWLGNLLGTALIGILLVLCNDSWKMLNGAGS
jgi:hypothetical protein